MNSLEANGDHSAICDVNQFFLEVTSTYEGLDRRVQQLVETLESLTPKQLEKACQAVRLEKERLKEKEQQLFAILDFTGEDLFNSPQLINCQAALEGANISCNLLYQKICSLREKMVLPEKLHQAIQTYQSLS